MDIQTVLPNLIFSSIVVVIFMRLITLRGKIVICILSLTCYGIIRLNKKTKVIEKSLLIFCTIIQLKIGLNDPNSASLPYPNVITRRPGAQSLPQLAHVFWNINLPGIKYHPKKKNMTRSANAKYIGSRLTISTITFIRACYRLKEVTPNNEFPLSMEHFLATSEMLFSILVTSDLFIPTEKKINPDIIYDALVFFLVSDGFSGSSIPIDPLERDSLLQM